MSILHKGRLEYLLCRANASHSYLLSFSLALSLYSFIVKSETRPPVLQFASRYLASNKQARQFVNHHMYYIVEMLLSRDCPTQEMTEYSCTAEDCLELAAITIAKNVAIQLKRSETSCVVDTLLPCFFHRGSTYIKVSKETRLGIK